MVPALEEGGISLDDLKSALISCNSLLTEIYAGRLCELTTYIEAYE